MHWRLLGAALLLSPAACTSGPGASDTGTPVDELRPIDRIARFLRADVSSSLEVRAVVSDDVEVPGDPWPRLEGLLDDVTDKPGGITTAVQSGSIPAQSWDLDALEEVFDVWREPAPDDLSVIEVLAVRGDYADGDGTVLGISWDWQHVVLFIDVIEPACAGAAGSGSGSNHTRICEATWAAILRHEVGHVLGLVNKELPMVEPHEDTEHPHHDPNEDCLMYWAWDRAGLSGKVAEEELELCPASLADLAAIRDADAPPQ